MASGAASAGGDIVGSMIGGKAANQAAQTAAQGQQQLVQQEFGDYQNYESAQSAALRNAISGLMAPKPQPLAPGQGGATFGGAQYSGGGAAPTSTAPPSQGIPGGISPYTPPVQKVM